MNFDQSGLVGQAGRLRVKYNAEVGACREKNPRSLPGPRRFDCLSTLPDNLDLIK